MEKQKRDNQIATQMEALVGMEGWKMLEEVLEIKKQALEDDMYRKMSGVPTNGEVAMGLMHDLNLKKCRYDAICRFLNEPRKLIKKKSIVQKDLEDIVKKGL